MHTLSSPSSTTEGPALDQLWTLGAPIPSPAPLCHTMHFPRIGKKAMSQLWASFPTLLATSVFRSTRFSLDHRMGNRLYRYFACGIDKQRARDMLQNLAVTLIWRKSEIFKAPKVLSLISYRRVQSNFVCVFGRDGPSGS